MPIYITQNGFFPVKESENSLNDNFFNFKLNGEQVSRRARRSHNPKTKKVRKKGKSYNREKTEDKKFVKKFSTMIDNRYHQSTNEGSGLKIKGIIAQQNRKKMERQNSKSYEDYEAEASYIMNEAFKEKKKPKIPNIIKNKIKVERQPAATAIFEDIDSVGDKSSELKNKMDKMGGQYQTFRIKKRKEMTLKSKKTRRFKIDEYGRFIKAKIKPGNLLQRGGSRPFSLEPSNRRLEQQDLGESQAIKSSRKGRFSSNTDERLFRGGKKDFREASERALNEGYAVKDRNVIANNYMRQNSRRESSVKPKRSMTNDRQRMFSKKKQRDYEKPWLMNSNTSKKKAFSKTQTGWRNSNGASYGRKPSNREQDFINFENYRKSIKEIITNGDKKMTDKAYATVGSEGFKRFNSKKSESKDEVKGVVKSLMDEKTNEKIRKKRRLNNYEIGPKLGKGSYAMVHLAIDIRNQGKYAIKTYDKKRLYNKTRRTIVEREIQVLAYCNHPKIIKLKKTIHTKNHIHLVMELANGMVLSKFHKSKPDKRLNERDAAMIFKQIVESVEYCHQNLIFHRDLKTENIMVDKEKNVKLIDFGFSLRQRSLGRLSLFCGTPNYMSPEVILKKEYYGGPNDIWALGVLLFRISSGRFPFVGKDDKSLHRKIINLDYRPSSRFSRDLTNLIRTILIFDPKKRPTCSKILEHPWLQNIR